MMRNEYDSRCGKAAVFYGIRRDRADMGKIEKGRRTHRNVRPFHAGKE
nr:MAG TPA: hypothetical protein [Caudoviricetes sp.]